MTKVNYERLGQPLTAPSKLVNLYQKVQSKVLKKEMSSNDPGNVDKPIETIHPDNLPGLSKDEMANSLAAVVERSSLHQDVTDSIHARMFGLGKLKWIHKLVPGIEKL